jgi:plastocyanin
VGLVAGPKGVKKFRSEAASTGYTFSRKLTVPGTYRLGCSLHHAMRMTITVRR